MKTFLRATALSAAMAIGVAGVAHAEAKYTFYHVLWSMTDANVQFHIKAGEAYMEAHPDVEIKYVGPEAYDPAEHAKFLDTVLNANPDGIAMHISSVDAMLPGLKAAKEKGIPFVSVTSHPPGAEDNAKLEGLYLTSVDANENVIGQVMGKRILEDGTPTRVAYLMAHLGHAGHEQRAKGFFETMPEGVVADKLAIGDEPLKAMDIIRSYIVSNPDVSVIWATSLANKWITDVVRELGREDIAILTDSDSPSSLECVLAELCTATFSTLFPLQAPFAYDVLLHYNETQMAPTAPIVTGPLVVDADNAEQFKTVVMNILGEDAYYDLSPF
ncbi:substrate-binding domain-containing protein [Oceanicola sp. 502str15]|uniref:substrate-binding domain-containing protein n=1 Tax=Oceanicola sp. 502str15 TaxID=2696061 RepID=UPI0020958C97|nr:substrate-binding domain-containing protein [Oceanicola sp. 502str15]MCO6385351.1 substrate-binding domain-containing protein [Oceanicola sp. 502str15]